MAQRRSADAADSRAASAAPARGRRGSRRGRHHRPHDGRLVALLLHVAHDALQRRGRDPHRRGLPLPLLRLRLSGGVQAPADESRPGPAAAARLGARPGPPRRGDARRDRHHGTGRPQARPLQPEGAQPDGLCLRGAGRQGTGARLLQPHERRAAGDQPVGRRPHAEEPAPHPDVRPCARPAHGRRALLRQGARRQPLGGVRAADRALRRRRQEAQGVLLRLQPHLLEQARRLHLQARPHVQFNNLKPRTYK